MFQKNSVPLLPQPPELLVVASANPPTPVTLAPSPIAIPPGCPVALTSTTPPLAAKEYLFSACDWIPNAMDAAPAAILLCPIEIDASPLATAFFTEPIVCVPMASEFAPVASPPLPIAVENIPLAVVLPPIANEYCPLAVVFWRGLPVPSSSLFPMATAPMAPALEPKPMAIPFSAAASTTPLVAAREFAPSAWDPYPIAVEIFPLAFVSLPIAVACNPLAVV